jgi:ERCC4-type nuclease
MPDRLSGEEPSMESFALVDRSRPAVREQILLIVDDREAADEMAWELRRRGHPVDVRELDDDGGAPRTRAGPQSTAG